MKIQFNMQTMQTIAFFERLTGAKVKDCIAEAGQLWFIIKEGDMPKAIGKGGSRVRRLEEKLKKKIRIVEYSEDMKQFIKNLIAPFEVKHIIEEEGVVTLHPVNTKTRGYLIGRNATTLRSYEAIIQRYFPLKELKVQ